ncbi:MAG: hypothetical protein RIM72_23210 [Alphaproteobacteria bacterium]
MIKIKTTRIRRQAAFALGVAALGFSLLQNALGEETGHGAPAQMHEAIVTIPQPREATLLRLRGIGGDGTATIRVNDQCYEMPVRIVAGDFEGESFRMEGIEPIRLRLQQPETVAWLFGGKDLVSEDFNVSDDPTATSADIVVLSGFPVGTGFILNPGANFLADIFGVRPDMVRCP